jgi:lipopolysaccharide/colanic/teichoic acid biosynthesis glycosyltransferase
MSTTASVDHPAPPVWRQSAVIPRLRHLTQERFYPGLKRLFDLIGALVGGLAVLALCPLIWLANRFTSPGDLFYWQERVGLHGRPFRMVKFRSMRMNAETETGAVWAQENDQRVTPVGHILRKSRLDEAPQVWNVLRGEMSLIGPRPERPEFVAGLAEQIPDFQARHAVKPGITGWAQVNYRYAASTDDTLIKLQYDLHYVKHRSMYLDLLILAKTILVMASFKGT